MRGTYSLRGQAGGPKCEMLFSSTATITTCGLGRCGGAQGLPGVQERQVGTPQDRHDLGGEAQEDHRPHRHGHPGSPPLARDRVFVEELARLLNHGGGRPVL